VPLQLTSARLRSSPTLSHVHVRDWGPERLLDMLSVYCLSACSCSFMPRGDKGGIGRTGKKPRAAAFRRAAAAAPAQEGSGSSLSLGPPAGGASSQWVMPSARESTASSSISPAIEAPVAPKPTPADEQPSILPLTLRLNDPRPLACPPAALSREDSKRRTRILTETHNDACECVEMGLPPPEHPDFTEHSPFCQVHVCYAREGWAAATPTSSGKIMAWS
jgi:hypothetical protein